jgi:hypothetical protein
MDLHRAALLLFQSRFKEAAELIAGTEVGATKPGGRGA